MSSGPPGLPYTRLDQPMAPYDHYPNSGPPYYTYVYPVPPVPPPSVPSSPMPSPLVPPPSLLSYSMPLHLVPPLLVPSPFVLPLPVPPPSPPLSPYSPSAPLSPLSLYSPSAPLSPLSLYSPSAPLSSLSPSPPLLSVSPHSTTEVDITRPPPALPVAVISRLSHDHQSRSPLRSCNHCDSGRNSREPTRDRRSVSKDCDDRTRSRDRRENREPRNRILRRYKSPEDTSNEESGKEDEQWYRNSSVELFYEPVDSGHNVVKSTKNGRKLAKAFIEKFVERSRMARRRIEKAPPPRPYRPKVNESSSESSSESDDIDHAERKRQQQDPRLLHVDLSFNYPGSTDTSSRCHCAYQNRKGIRHGVYVSENFASPCDLYSNNADRLFHYRITISPLMDFLIKTVITEDDNEFIFSGFSLLSHYPLTTWPACVVERSSIKYTITYVEEQPPINYTIEELNLFEEFLFQDTLELINLDMGKRTNKKCSLFHLLPRWERALDGGGSEVLAMANVLRHLIRSVRLLISPSSLPILRNATEKEWRKFNEDVKGMIVTYPGKKPSSIRIDRLDRNLLDDSEDSNSEGNEPVYPEIVHFNLIPITNFRINDYKKAQRECLKHHYLLKTMENPSVQDEIKLESKEATLQKLKTKTQKIRGVTVSLSAEGFYRTGIMCDVVEHAMFIPALISHIRFHNSLSSLEKAIGYNFKNRHLLQIALTHPSYPAADYGTNPDHAQNCIRNCGIRRPEHGKYSSNIKKECTNLTKHNGRLEFLGEAVVSFLVTICLFRMLPMTNEGMLTNYRMAIVAFPHLAVLAKKLELEPYMLYTHNLVQIDSKWKQAMSSCFKSLIGALFLDGGIDEADRVLSMALWRNELLLHEVWTKPRLHILQEQEPHGDREWVNKHPFLQKLVKFEESIGVTFKHIRLLARAFTDHSVGMTELTLGSNERLEFLGDAVLELISSEYLYTNFPEYTVHLLCQLRMALVNNKTQAIVCDDLAMSYYARYHYRKSEINTKDKADLVEAFLGALYLDQGMQHCKTFCAVCHFPRLKEFYIKLEAGFENGNDVK